MKTPLANGYYVESWYDRRTRSWVTQLKDANGNQIGDADYSGAKKTMQSTHKARIKNVIPKSKQ